MPDSDPYNLQRFIVAQEPVFATVLAELNRGRKTSHWMWFIFPQIDGLGRSPTTSFYAIKSPAEARQYLEHPMLGARLVRCAETILASEGKSAREIFGSPDDKKLKSSMTLFAAISGPGSVFARVLEKYFAGKPDQNTLDILGRAEVE